MKTDVKGEDGVTMSAAELVDKYDVVKTVQKMTLTLKNLVMAHEHPDELLDHLKAKVRLTLHRLQAECIANFNVFRFRRNLIGASV